MGANSIRPPRAKTANSAGHQDHSPALDPKGVGCESVYNALNEFQVLEFGLHRCDPQWRSQPRRIRIRPASRSCLSTGLYTCEVPNIGSSCSQCRGFVLLLPQGRARPARSISNSTPPPYANHKCQIEIGPGVVWQSLIDVNEIPAMPRICQIGMARPDRNGERLHQVTVRM